MLLEIDENGQRYVFALEYRGANLETDKLGGGQLRFIADYNPTTHSFGLHERVQALRSFAKV